jgi:hypothetical protein
MVRFGKVQMCVGLGIVLLALLAVQVPLAHGQTAQPIAVTGWNADIVMDKDPTTLYAIAADNGDCAYFEAGALDASGTQHDDGLPSGMTFDSLTGQATYQLQPANGNNVLQLYHLQTGTLSLVTPAAYSSLFVIASAGNGSGNLQVFPGVVHYDDGSTLSFTYNNYDWCNAFNHPEAAIAGMGRTCQIPDAGGSFGNYGACGNGTGAYETQILTDNTKKVVSIDFSGRASTHGGSISNIFAVSGQ